MPQREDLTGQKFEYLTVISKGLNIQKGKSVYTTWNCICDCNNVLIENIETRKLKNGDRTSCGCGRERNKNKMIGRIFGELTVIGEAPKQIAASGRSSIMWNCKCSCGNMKTFQNGHLKNGSSNNCGCFSKIFGHSRKQEPNISSAKNYFDGFQRRKYKCTLTFEEFCEEVVKNCYYCGLKPFKVHNRFANSNEASLYAKENGNFICNSLDRINSKQDYTNINVVSSCVQCNCFKLYLLLYQFNKNITSLGTTFTHNLPPITLKLPIGELLKNIEYIYNKNYINGGHMLINDDMTVEVFYSYSQLPCYYCGKSHLNSNNARLFKYNGIDRINSTGSYTIGNIVPCCKFCNSAKLNLPLQEFLDWQARIKNYQEETQSISKLINSIPREKLLALLS